MSPIGLEGSHMHEQKNYIEHFGDLGLPLNVLDIDGRKIKAAKIIHVLQDFTKAKNKRLLDLTCLDIGCSTGLITKTISGKFKKVVGIDIDQVAIKRAKEEPGPENAEFVWGSGLNLHYRDGSFDVVICNHVYDHVPDPYKLFSEIHRVMKDDGFCYLAAANKYTHLMEAHYRLPFLSWLPQNLANLYLRITRKGTVYRSKLMPYWKLRRALTKFDVVDYTIVILKNPDKYWLTDALKPNSLIRRIISKTPNVVLRFLNPLIPSHIFVLSK